MPTLKILAGILHQLEACNSTMDKIETIQKFENMGSFKEMLWWALNPYKKFGIQKIPFVNGVELIQSDSVWKDVITFLNRASSNAVSGGALKNEFEDLLRSLIPYEREVLRRVVLKDLRCGVGATLVNKAIPELIPEFGIMLAETLEERHLKILRQQQFVYFQAKKNGDRSAHVIDDSPQAYSRNGHEQLNYGHITAACKTVCDRAQEYFTFDGEVIMDDFWGTRKVKKLAGNQAEGAVLHVFDIIPIAQWVTRNTSSYSTRRRILKNIWDYVSPEMPLKRVPSYQIEGANVTWELIEEWRLKFVAMGEEGLMIRLDKPYNFSTRNSLYKRKLMKEGDFMILEIREGEAGKKYENMAAKVLVDLGNGVSCEVGLKGDVDTRRELWNHRNKYAGMMCEVHFQGWTECEDGEKRLQFGIMHRVRADKS